MSNLIRNNTSSLRRSINIRSPKGGTTTGQIDRVGPASVGRDGRMWSMVYGTTLGGSPFAFAAVNDGPPKWAVR